MNSKNEPSTSTIDNEIRLKIPSKTQQISTILKTNERIPIKKSNAWMLPMSSGKSDLNKYS